MCFFEDNYEAFRTNWSQQLFGCFSSGSCSFTWLWPGSLHAGFLPLWRFLASLLCPWPILFVYRPRDAPIPQSRPHTGCAQHRLAPGALCRPQKLLCECLVFQGNLLRCNLVGYGSWHSSISYFSLLGLEGRAPAFLGIWKGGSLPWQIFQHKRSLL